MFIIENVLEDKVILATSSEAAFIIKCNKIAEENEDVLLQTVSECIDYINTNCSNLLLTVS